jgi:hypothetical protein
VMDTYLNGLYLFNRGAVREAAALSRETIAQDSDFAGAYLLLGMTSLLQADFHQTTYSSILPRRRAHSGGLWNWSRTTVSQ